MRQDEENTTANTTYQTNKLIIKNNASVNSLYDLKRPQIIKTGNHVRKHRRDNAHNNTI